jgi:hypothetical protein
MALDEVTTRLLRELMERVSTEHAPENLQELVLAVNRLLDAIEAQIAKIEGPNDPSVH